MSPASPVASLQGSNDDGVRASGAEEELQQKFVKVKVIYLFVIFTSFPSLVFLEIIGSGHGSVWSFYILPVYVCDFITQSTYIQQLDFIFHFKWTVCMDNCSRPAN